MSDGGATGAVEPAGAPFGTTVEVHNLFFNVPARRNFLKQDRFELAQIVEILTRLALPDPDWTLELVERRQERCSWPRPAAATRTGWRTCSGARSPGGSCP